MLKTVLLSALSSQTATCLDVSIGRKAEGIAFRRFHYLGFTHQNMLKIVNFYAVKIVIDFIKFYR